jgi:hypothetical protein
MAFVLSAVPCETALASRGMAGPEIRQLVTRVSLEHGLDPQLVHSVVTVESGYNVRAVSPKGALGLMQLMPATARQLRVRNAFDPEQNVRGGVRWLGRLLERFNGDVVLALAAYNAGEGAVLRYGGVPPYRETRQYVARIMQLYTGEPFDWTKGRVNPVRLVREHGSGRVVITNSGFGQSPTRTTLGGGFGD